MLFGLTTSGLFSAAGWLFVAGTLLFSFSLYELCFTQKRWWGAVTPFGGLAFIAGRACLALATWAVELPYRHHGRVTIQL